MCGYVGVWVCGVYRNSKEDLLLNVVDFIPREITIGDVCITTCWVTDKDTLGISLPDSEVVAPTANRCNNCITLGKPVLDRVELITIVVLTNVRTLGADVRDT